MHNCGTIEQTFQYIWFVELLFVFCRTMKAGVGLISSLILFLLIGAVFTQRPRPKKPTKRPPTTRKPPVPKPVWPTEAEPQEPTDFPPPILGPPSIFPNCPRECTCNPSYPNALNCENRNLRVVPVIPLGIHYLYLQNNYISEVTAEAFNNATEVRWINLANNRIQKIDKQVRGHIANKTHKFWKKKCPQNYFYISAGMISSSGLWEGPSTAVFVRAEKSAQRSPIRPPCNTGTTSSRQESHFEDSRWSFQQDGEPDSTWPALQPGEPCCSSCNKLMCFWSR